MPRGVAAVQPSDAELIEAYRRLGSVRRVGAELGVDSNPLGARLRGLGVRLVQEPITDAERQRVSDYYKTTPDKDFNVERLALEMGRRPFVVSRIASQLGLARSGRPHRPDTVERMTALTKEWHKNNEHPRGMLGKKHTKETLEAVSRSSKRLWATWNTFRIGPASPEAREKNRQAVIAYRATVPPEKMFTRARGGRRPDLGETFFRSSWEANYARYLNLLMKLGAVERWEYEPQTFWFHGVKRGTNSYRPDFVVKYKGDETPEYIELKGWVTPKDHTKWRRMAKYHPHIKLVVVGAKEYDALKRKWASSIPEWESAKGGGHKTGLRKGARVTITPIT